MPMRKDFCAFILTHDRPDNVITYKALLSHGYTGDIFIVIDDEDTHADEYRAQYGDAVLVFDKRDIAARYDEGDNFGDRRTVFYARNACFELARQTGHKFFIELDDDYNGFYCRYDQHDLDYSVMRITGLDHVFSSMVDFLERVPRCLSIAMSQGGDHIGGGDNSPIRFKRKAMNTFVCATDRQFSWVGKINEDVNTYTCEARRGQLFFTFMGYQCNQSQTQLRSGGMTDIYLDGGTYIKTFYTIMYAPSCVKISTLNDGRTVKHNKRHTRIHHLINWNAVAPKIIHESYKVR